LTSRKIPHDRIKRPGYRTFETPEWPKKLLFFCGGIASRVFWVVGRAPGVLCHTNNPRVAMGRNA